MPAPIALAWRAFEEETRPFYRLNRLVDVYETLLKYLAILAIQNFYAADFAKHFPEIDQRIRRQIPIPTLGAWKYLLKDVVACFAHRPEDLFCSDLYLFCFRAGGATKLQKHFSRDSWRIVELRNAYVGHGATLDDNKSNELVEKCKGSVYLLLDKAAFLTRLPLYYFDSSPAGAYLMMGTHLRQASPLPHFIPAFPDNHLCVHNPEAGRMLDLHPLLVYRKCKEQIAVWDAACACMAGARQCQQFHVFFFNSFRHQLDFLEYSQGHHSRYQSPDRLPEEFQSAFPKPSAVAFQPLLQRGNRFQETIDSLTEYFVGRARELEQLHHCVQRSAQRIVLIVGPPGYGKSALVARWLEQQPAARHFIRSGDVSTSHPRYIFENFTLQLCEHYHLEFTRPSLPETKDYYRIFMDTLTLASEKSPDSKVLLALDGVDEATRLPHSGQDETGTILDWLPEPSQLPENVCMVLACRTELLDYPAFAAKFDHDKAAILQIGRMQDEDVRALLSEIHSKYDVLDSEEYIKTIVAHSEGSPLYLRMLLHDLNEERLIFGNSEILPVGVQAYFERILNYIECEGKNRELPDIERMLQAKRETLESLIAEGILTQAQVDAKMAQESAALEHKTGVKSIELLALLCIAKAPLSLSESAAILQAASLNIQQAFEIIRTVLIPIDVAGEIRFTLFHSGFREYVLNLGKYTDARFHRYAATIETVRARLLDYCRDWRRHKSRYVLAWLPTHLFESGNHAELKTLLFTFSFLEEKAYNYPLSDILQDLGLLRQQDEKLTLMEKLLWLELPHLSLETCCYILPQLYSRLAEFDERRRAMLLPHFQEVLAASRRLPAVWLKRLNACWNRIDDALIYTLSGHAGAAHEAAFAPDGKIVASGSADTTIKLWDVITGQVLKSLCGHTDVVWAVAFAPTGKQVASAGQDALIKLWDCESGQEVMTLQGHKDWVWSLAYAPDGTTLASGSRDCTINIWDLTTGRLLHTLTGHDALVRAVAFSPDGKFLASGSKDHTIKLWDCACWTVCQTFTGHADWVYTVAFSPDSRYLVSGSWDKTIKLWDLATGAECATYRGHEHRIQSVAFSHDGLRLASGSWDKTIRLWDRDSGEVLRTLKGHAHWVRSVAFAPDSRQIVSSSEDKTLKLWNAETDKTFQALAGHAHWVHAVAFTPDGRFLASGSRDKTIKLWDAASGQELRTLHSDSHWIYALAFSPDGQRLLSAGKDSRLRLWDLATGSVIRNLPGHSHWIYAVAFSPDGTLIASGSADQILKVWEASSGEVLLKLKGHADDILSVAFSPDGSLLASGGKDRAVILWDVRTGEAVQTFSGHEDRICSLAFSPDGKQLVSGSADTTFRIWERESGALLRVFNAHAACVSSLAFSPDGRQIVSGSRDKTLKLWDGQTGEPLTTFWADAALLCARFSPDGREIWAADDYRAPRIYRFEIVRSF